MASPRASNASHCDCECYQLHSAAASPSTLGSPFGHQETRAGTPDRLHSILAQAMLFVQQHGLTVADPLDAGSASLPWALALPPLLAAKLSPPQHNDSHAAAAVAAPRDGLFPDAWALVSTQDVNAAALQPNVPSPGHDSSSSANESGGLHSDDHVQQQFVRYQSDWWLQAELYAPTHLWLRDHRTAQHMASAAARLRAGWEEAKEPTDETASWLRCCAALDNAASEFIAAEDMQRVGPLSLGLYCAWIVSQPSAFSLSVRCSAVQLLYRILLSPAPSTKDGARPSRILTFSGCEEAFALRPKCILSVSHTRQEGPGSRWLRERKAALQRKRSQRVSGYTEGELGAMVCLLLQGGLLAADEVLLEGVARVCVIAATHADFAGTWLTWVQVLARVVMRHRGSILPPGEHVAAASVSCSAPRSLPLAYACFRMLFALSCAVQGAVPDYYKSFTSLQDPPVQLLVATLQVALLSRLSEAGEDARVCAALLDGAKAKNLPRVTDFARLLLVDLLGREVAQAPEALGDWAFPFRVPRLSSTLQLLSARLFAWLCHFIVQKGQHHQPNHVTPDPLAWSVEELLMPWVAAIILTQPVPFRQEEADQQEQQQQPLGLSNEVVQSQQSSSSSLSDDAWIPPMEFPWTMPPDCPDHDAHDRHAAVGWRRLYFDCDNSNSYQGLAGLHPASERERVLEQQGRVLRVLFAALPPIDSRTAAHVDALTCLLKAMLERFSHGVTGDVHHASSGDTDNGAAGLQELWSVLFYTCKNTWEALHRASSSNSDDDVDGDGAEKESQPLVMSSASRVLFGFLCREGERAGLVQSHTDEGQICFTLETQDALAHFDPHLLHKQAAPTAEQQQHLSVLLSWPAWFRSGQHHPCPALVKCLRPLFDAAMYRAACSSQTKLRMLVVDRLACDIFGKYSGYDKDEQLHSAARRAEVHRVLDGMLLPLTICKLLADWAAPDHASWIDWLPVLLRWQLEAEAAAPQSPQQEQLFAWTASLLNLPDIPKPLLPMFVGDILPLAETQHAATERADGAAAAAGAVPPAAAAAKPPAEGRWVAALRSLFDGGQTEEYVKLLAPHMTRILRVLALQDPTDEVLLQSLQSPLLGPALLCDAALFNQLERMLHGTQQQRQVDAANARAHAETKCQQIEHEGNEVLRVRVTPNLQHDDAVHEKHVLAAHFPVADSVPKSSCSAEAASVLSLLEDLRAQVARPTLRFSHSAATFLWTLSERVLHHLVTHSSKNGDASSSSDASSQSPPWPEHVQCCLNKVAKDAASAQVAAASATDIASSLPASVAQCYADSVVTWSGGARSDASSAVQAAWPVVQTVLCSVLRPALFDAVAPHAPLLTVHLHDLHAAAMHEGELMALLRFHHMVQPQTHAQGGTHFFSAAQLQSEPVTYLSQVHWTWLALDVEVDQAVSSSRTCAAADILVPNAVWESFCPPRPVYASALAWAQSKALRTHVLSGGSLGSESAPLWAAAEDSFHEATTYFDKGEEVKARRRAWNDDGFPYRSWPSNLTHFLPYSIAMSCLTLNPPPAPEIRQRLLALAAETSVLCGHDVALALRWVNTHHRRILYCDCCDNGNNHNAEAYDAMLSWWISSITEDAAGWREEAQHMRNSIHPQPSKRLQLFDAEWHRIVTPHFRLWCQRSGVHAKGCLSDPVMQVLQAMSAHPQLAHSLLRMHSDVVLPVLHTQLEGMERSRVAAVSQILVRMYMDAPVANTESPLDEQRIAAALEAAVENVVEPMLDKLVVWLRECSPDPLPSAAPAALGAANNEEDEDDWSYMQLLDGYLPATAGALIFFSGRLRSDATLPVDALPVWCLVRLHKQLERWSPKREPASTAKTEGYYQPYSSTWGCNERTMFDAHMLAMLMEACQAWFQRWATSGKARYAAALRLFWPHGVATLKAMTPLADRLPYAEAQRMRNAMKQLAETMARVHEALHTADPVLEESASSGGSDAVAPTSSALPEFLAVLKDKSGAIAEAFGVSSGLGNPLEAALCFSEHHTVQQQRAREAKLLAGERDVTVLLCMRDVMTTHQISVESLIPLLQRVLSSNAEMGSLSPATRTAALQLWLCATRQLVGAHDTQSPAANTAVREGNSSDDEQAKQDGADKLHRAAASPLSAASTLRASGLLQPSRLSISELLALLSSIFEALMVLSSSSLPLVEANLLAHLFVALGEATVARPRLGGWLGKFMEAAPAKQIRVHEAMWQYPQPWSDADVADAGPNSAPMLSPVAVRVRILMFAWRRLFGLVDGRLIDAVQDQASVALIVRYLLELMLSRDSDSARAPGADSGCAAGLSTLPGPGLPHCADFMLFLFRGLANQQLSRQPSVLGSNEYAPLIKITQRVLRDVVLQLSRCVQLSLPREDVSRPRVVVSEWQSSETGSASRVSLEFPRLRARHWTPELRQLCDAMFEAFAWLPSVVDQHGVRDHHSRSPDILPLFVAYLRDLAVRFQPELSGEQRSHLIGMQPLAELTAEQNAERQASTLLATLLANACSVVRPQMPSETNCDYAYAQGTCARFGRALMEALVPFLGRQWPGTTEGLERSPAPVAKSPAAAVPPHVCTGLQPHPQHLLIYLASPVSERSCNACHKVLTEHYECSICDATYFCVACTQWESATSGCAPAGSHQALRAACCIEAAEAAALPVLFPPVPPHDPSAEQRDGLPEMPTRLQTPLSSVAVSALHGYFYYLAPPYSVQSQDPVARVNRLQCWKHFADVIERWSSEQPTAEADVPPLPRAQRLYACLLLVRVLLNSCQCWWSFPLEASATDNAIRRTLAAALKLAPLWPGLADLALSLMPSPPDNNDFVTSLRMRVLACDSDQALARALASVMAAKNCEPSLRQHAQAIFPLQPATLSIYLVQHGVSKIDSLAQLPQAAVDNLYALLTSEHGTSLLHALVRSTTSDPQWSATFVCLLREVSLLPPHNDARMRDLRARLHALLLERALGCTSFFHKSSLERRSTNLPAAAGLAPQARADKIVEGCIAEGKIDDHIIDLASVVKAATGGDDEQKHLPNPHATADAFATSRLRAEQLVAVYAELIRSVSSMQRVPAALAAALFRALDACASSSLLRAQVLLPHLEPILRLLVEHLLPVAAVPIPAAAAAATPCDIAPTQDLATMQVPRSLVPPSALEIVDSSMAASVSESSAWCQRCWRSRCNVLTAPAGPPLPLLLSSLPSAVDLLTTLLRCADVHAALVLQPHVASWRALQDLAACWLLRVEPALDSTLPGRALRHPVLATQWQPPVTVEQQLSWLSSSLSDSAAVAPSSVSSESGVEPQPPWAPHTGVICRLVSQVFAASERYGC